MIICKNESLLNVTSGVILHGCNCFCTMGAGVAKLLRDKYPIVEKVDNATLRGDRKKLGNYTRAAVDGGLTILNCYTQYLYSSWEPQIDYDALSKCFEKIKFDFPNTNLSIPRIGCGLAGGDWDIVSQMIESIFDDRTVYVYY
jgi:O-acetyl-ADP-ribose deacetylase (regulator of RNase III)